jgi:L-lactate dehydrogenase complex protein LldG
VTSARETILRRIRDTQGGQEAPITRTYRRSGTLDTVTRVALFIERARDYGAHVHHVRPIDLKDAVSEACAIHGGARVVAPTGVPDEWRPPHLPFVEDNTDWSARDLDALDGVVTGCTIGIAETGTIILTAGPREGRRALTLIPDLHICVVESSQIVELVPEAIRRTSEVVRATRRPVTLISGPSATSDIELSRVEGVHGPRTLVVLVVCETPRTMPHDYGADELMARE